MNRTPSIADYRCKLMNKILFARSPDEVRRYIGAAIKSLREHKVNDHLIARFIERAVQDLSQFHPEDEGAQQWSNIRAAQIQFLRLKGK